MKDTDIRISVSAGELLDRILILKLKIEGLEEDSENFKDVSRELSSLEREWETTPKLDKDSFWKVVPLISQLAQILKKGWHLENAMRKKIGSKNYNTPEGAKSYIETSIEVHSNNDKRNQIKNEITSFFDKSKREIKIFTRD